MTETQLTDNDLYFFWGIVLNGIIFIGSVVAVAWWGFVLLVRRWRRS